MLNTILTNENEVAVTARRTTVTRKGQITIPVEIRRALQLSEGDQIAVERQGDAVLLRRAVPTAARTAGLLAAYRKPSPLSADEERAAFADAVAAEAVDSSEA